MTDFQVAVLSWVLAIGIVVANTLYRGDGVRPVAQTKAVVTPSVPVAAASQELDEVIACKARDDAERLAVAFNKTTELKRALEDPNSEASGVSRRLLVGGRCAHFEHKVRFAPVAMPFDGTSFAPVLEKPFNVIEADVTLVNGSDHFFLVTEWRPEAQS